MTQACCDLEQLEQLLGEPLSSVREREKSELDRLLQRVGKRVVLFGAGKLGRQVLACLRTIGIEPLGFSDTNQQLWGKQIDRCGILSPEDAGRRFGADALFIVTIWNPQHWYGPTRDRLRAAGCVHIAPVSAVYWRFSDDFLPFYCQDLPQKIYTQSAPILAAAELWSDGASSAKYIDQIRWRALGEWDSFIAPDPEESYFPAHLFELSEREAFVDCGAFDGDTIRSFLARRGPSFQSIWAIEADGVTFRTLRSYVDGLEPVIRQKIKLLYGAVGAQSGWVSFADSKVAQSKGDDASQVECFCLDSLLEQEPVSYIKMDIEGAEYDTLLGARKTIERERPVLAVCVYHTQDDLWRIPLLIRDMVPDYKFHLGRYEGDGWQTVAYAIPPERLKHA